MPGLEGCSLAAGRHEPAGPTAAEFTRLFRTRPWTSARTRKHRSRERHEQGIGEACGGRNRRPQRADDRARHEIADAVGRGEHAEAGAADLDRRQVRRDRPLERLLKRVAGAGEDEYEHRA